MFFDGFKLSTDAERESMERTFSSRLLGFLLSLFLSYADLGLNDGLRRLALVFIAVVRPVRSLALSWRVIGPRVLLRKLVAAGLIGH